MPLSRESSSLDTALARFTKALIGREEFVVLDKKIDGPSSRIEGLNAEAETPHAVLEDTDRSDPGVTAERGMVEGMIAKAQSSIESMQTNLFSHGWDDGASRKVEEQKAQLQSLIARRDEYAANRATEDALRAQVHDWKAFMANRTTEDLCELYHGSIRRIDVDFEAGVALTHWTFTLTTSRIDVTRDKARARERTRASKKSSIDEPVGRVSGQVVQPREIDRSSRPLLGALLTVLQARSAETAARSAAGAAIKQRPSTVSR